MAPLFPPLVEAYDFETTGRGHRCVRDVAQGEELLAIPLEDCWTATDARAAVQLKPVLDADSELSDLNVTALHLLVERAKGPESSRWAHLQQLPTEYDSTLLWSAEQLHELEGSPWHQLAARFADEARQVRVARSPCTSARGRAGVPAVALRFACPTPQDWAALQQSVARAGCGALLEGASERDYLWAYTTIKSRTAEVLVDGAKANLLAPNFDMFNHDESARPSAARIHD